MANTDFIQATIEIFGAIITAVIALTFMVITGNRKKSEKNIFMIMLASGFALLMDAGWYIFDGNNATYAMVMNHFCNFALFICNPFMVMIVNRYICNLTIEQENKPLKALVAVAYTIAVIALLIPVSNLIIKWMYYFDEINVYHRMDGWYIYTALNSLSMVASFVLVVAHRKLIKKARRIALYVFFFVQILGIAIQAFQIGISFIQLGSALGCIIVVASYLVEWIRRENEGVEVSEDKKKLWLFECVFAIMILFVSTAIITCAVSVNSVSNENSQQNSTALAYMVGETVEEALSEPINVSKTMAQSEEIISALTQDNISNSSAEAKMLGFMNRIRDLYGYQTVFVASDKSKSYYTCEGFSRYMNVEETAQDAWYSEFLNKDVKYELNIDTDKDHNKSLAAFVNYAVVDGNDNFIGVCGVAMSMDALMDILAQYEEDYNLNIALTNTDGLVQVSTDKSRIENDYYDMSKVNQAQPKDIAYLRDATKAIMVKNMGEYGWYLIIEDNNPDKLNVFRIILPSMVIYVLGVVIMLIFSLIFAVHERHRNSELRVSKEQSETAIAESNAKGRFLANMSHEIRTPINAVLGMDTMILRESKEPKIKEYAMIIRDSSNILLSLINDILDISKIESGKMELVPEQYDLAVLINDVINMVNIKAQAKKLEIKMDIDNNLPTALYGDDVRLRQVIVNVMNNAVKYTEKGSVTLSVRGEKSDNQIRLRVSIKDTGVGIREEDIQKLFEDFVRIDESRNKNIEGTGLGMSITVQLLELMGSRLEVSSVYGEGSDFSFVVSQEIIDERPIGDISANMLNRSQEYDYNALFTARDAKVLVVDDNEVNRVVFVDLLKDTKLDIDEADCGKRAVELIFNNYYDIIFLDHMMPDMDGVEVLERVKSNPNHPNTDTPIIVLTANAIFGAREEYMSAGFDGYLSKPIIPEQLEKTILQLLPKEKIVINDYIEKQDTDNEPDLPVIQGVDWYYAQLHLPDRNALMNALKSFVATIESEADKLKGKYEELLANPDAAGIIEEYRIQVHAMKSTATLLGCVPIAGMAASLEKAAQNSRINTIRDITPHFLESWLEYKNKYAFLDNNSQPKRKIDDISKILDYLKILKDAISEFDVHGADAAFEELKVYEYGDDIDPIMDKINAAVSSLDVEETIGLCDEMADSLVNSKE